MCLLLEYKKTVPFGRLEAWQTYLPTANADVCGYVFASIYIYLFETAIVQQKKKKDIKKEFFS